MLGLEGAQDIDALVPLHRVAEPGAPKCMNVGQGRPLNGFCRQENVCLWKVEGDFVRCLAWHVDELHFYAGDLCLKCLVKCDVRLDEGRIAATLLRADAAVHVFGVFRAQENTKCVTGAHSLDGAHRAALADNIADECFVRDDLNFAADDIFFAYEGFYTTPMVRVKV